MRASLAPTLVCATLWREAAAARLLLCSLDASSAGFCAGVRHSVVRGGGCKAAAVLARRGLRWPLRWRALPCDARRRLQGRRRARLTPAPPAFTAVLAQRGLRGHLRWCAPPCGARRRPQGRCCARSTRAPPASTLVCATLWCEAVATRPPPRSLDAGSAGLRWPLRWRALPCGVRRRLRGRCRACSKPAPPAFTAVLAQRGLHWHLRWCAPSCGARRRLQGRCRARSTRAPPASTLTGATLWRGAVATRPLPCSFDTGSAGFYAGVRHLGA